MSPLEIAVVGVVGAAGLGLVCAGAFLARRRRLAAEGEHRDDEPSVRRIRVDFEEDPIVAALGVGGEAKRRRRP